MAAAHCVMKRMLIPILRTAQARVFVEQPPECADVSGVGGTHGLPNRLALLVVEFQWLNHKTLRPMFATDDISMTGASASRGRIRLDESHDARACGVAQRLRAVPDGSSLNLFVTIVMVDSLP